MTTSATMGSKALHTIMKMLKRLALSLCAVGALAAVATPASAESQLVNGAGSATARLDFRVIVPRILFLGVGTGAAALAATNTTIDRLTFDYTASPAAVGQGIPSASQNVSVRVLGNNGQVTLVAAAAAPLTSAVGDTIAWTEIGAISSSGDLPHPVIGGGTSNVTLNGGKITARSATWEFFYQNTAVVAPGTYDGRVVYTAAMP
jgi:hypothetical protein